jgi:phenylpropionate dioxygenase-like ring-hydroxylating dioxygenase large terminal subunit
MTDLPHLLIPPQSKGHTSVVRLLDQWYVICAAKSLGKQPISRRILGIPMVLFRTDNGTPAALLDRCPHRNVPLSLGKVIENQVECPYHGWRFNSDGRCTHVPGLCREGGGKGRQVSQFPCLEQDGFIWVYPAGGTPSTAPFRFPLLDQPDYLSIRRSLSAEGTLHAVIENALDVPHTAYIHKNLFRKSEDSNEIEVVVRRKQDRVEAEYIGEPRPSGLIGRILSPSGGIVSHYDRFILPSILQVEYQIGDENHILVTAACTPESDFVTHLHAVIAIRSRIPSWIIRMMIPLGLGVFKQDAVILKAQTETIRAFGGEQFVSTEIDILGPQIWRLLRAAERGQLDDMLPAEEKRLTLRA